jgi:hypothetical protein
MAKFDVIVIHSNTHPTRDRNIRCIIPYYKKHLSDCRIIVSEQNSYSNFSDLPVDIHVHTPDDKTFSRTHVFNRGFRETESEYVILADNDCIVHQDCLNNLDKEMEDCDFLLPYDMVHNWNPQETEDFIRNGRMAKGQSRIHRNTGGVNVIKRSVYIDVRGFDPHIKGWGCEDSIFHEKIRRFHKVKRYTKHNLYHMFHNVQYAKGRNPEFKFNDSEWHRIRKLNNEEMRDYINNIPLKNIMKDPE